MRSIVMTALILPMVLGCATSRTAVGHFAPDVLTAHDQRMAADAARQLARVYPPALTRFALGQNASDAFGRSLLSALRAKGYAVAEFNAAASKSNEPIAAASAVMVVEGVRRTVSTADLSLQYVVDQTTDPYLLRVVLLVGSQSLIRGYLAQNGEVVPAGSWVRKE